MKPRTVAQYWHVLKTLYFGFFLARVMDMHLQSQNVHLNRIVKSWMFAPVSLCASSHLVKLGTTAQYWHILEIAYFGFSLVQVMDLHLQLQTICKNNSYIEE